ncbi:DUF6118 family protein [Brucella tritici]|uniref:Uncharacterized protein n=1 Tax=Brucella tritici TaxID=94626 RepID=A0A6L3Y3J0_9HYPH|nr:DUF6118 family protein [Brucella tritici]KAB2674579.1 hypothetical protein F9L08_28485 [Brucella tritici]
MADDYRDERQEGAESEAFHDDDAGDPAIAFEALRATIEDLSVDLKQEMTTIRKGVEAAFDQFERQDAPIDYSADLGTMSQQLATLAERVHGVEKSPILRQGAEHYARALENSGKGLVQAAAQQFQSESRDFQRVARELAEQTYSARDRRRQDWWLVGVGATGIVLGIMLALFAPRVLPFSTAPRAASVIMGGDPWQAGMNMMMFASPDSWGRVASADKLIEDNKAAVADCRAAAAKAGKEQKCTIIVPAPEKTP